MTQESASKLAWEDEVLLVLDESDLRKPFATNMEYLDTVRSLDGKLIPGFRTLNVLGVGASGQRTILYHHSFSASAPNFKSVSVEYKRAMGKVTNALRKVGAGRLLWVIHQAGDDLALMRHLHEVGSSFVIRVQHVTLSGSAGKEARTPTLPKLWRLPLCWAKPPWKDAYLTRVVNNTATSMCRYGFRHRD